MSVEWPAVAYDAWRASCDTLHAHTQVLGKLAVTLAPPEPQLQHGALRLSARGWETLPLPAPDGSGSLVIARCFRGGPAGRRVYGGCAVGREALPKNAMLLCRAVVHVLRAASG